MECVLAVNSLLRRHCGQSLSRVRGSGSLIPVLTSALFTLLKTLFCLGLPLFSELLCMWPQVHPKPLDTIL